MTIPARSDERRHPALVGFGVLLAAGSAWCALHPFHDADAFWHMALGRAVLAAGSRVVPEPLALAAFSEPAVVPEWLWGVLTLQLHQAGGYSVLSLLPSVLAAACALLILQLARTCQRPSTFGATALVSGATMALSLSRLRLRPQTACLLLLPAFIWLTLRFIQARGRERAWLGAGLVLSELLWAQLHGSFVLAPCVFAIAAADGFGAMTRELRRSTLLVGLALVAGLLSSAYGAGLFEYILTHRSGYAVLHVADMQPPRWEQFNPTTSFYGPLYAGLWLLGLVGVVIGRELPRVALGFALLSLLLGSSSARFLGESAALLVPWAMFGAEAVLEQARATRVWRWLPWVCAALGLGLIARTTRAVDEQYGPLGKIGIAEAAMPLAAAVRLSSLPKGSAVLTAYSAGGPIGFLTHGHVRTYVDGRTPLYFDDTDFALSREVFGRKDTLALAAQRYAAAAIVVERSRETCTFVPAGFVPVAVDPVYTTFARAPAEAALTRIAPCGWDYLTPDACSDGGAALDAEIARVAKLRDSPFVRFLQAARAVTCGGNLGQASALLGPDDARVDGYLMERRRVRGALLMKQGRVAEAFLVLEGDIRAGALVALDTLGPAIVSGEVALPAVRDALEGAIATLDDATPAYVRNVLAHVCMTQNDAECVRFHGTRAALIEPSTRQFRKPLQWLAQHHPSARVRDDVARWLQSLQAADADRQRAIEPAP